MRSRIRTAGKPGFGRVGLVDASGNAVFGMDADGPNATTDEVADYLRNLGAKDWGASLDVAVSPRKSKPERAAANDSDPRPGPQPGPKAKLPRPVPQPKPKLREARPSDIPRLVELVQELGYEISEKQLRKNLAALRKSGETPIVATLSKKVVGVCGIGRRVVIHRPAPVGRISALVVSRAVRRQGIGRMLVEAAEGWMRNKGCTLVEVTSNDRLAQAHAFYRHLGYERSSIRFFKEL